MRSPLTFIHKEPAMKKILLLTGWVFLLLASLGCANYATTRRVNALYEKVNDMQSSIIALEKRVKELNAKILEIKGPPTADLATLEERINEINEQYIRLAKELIKVQQKAGVAPMELVPPSYK